MSNASEIYNTLINDVTVLGPISYQSLKRGDLVARIDKGITTIFTYDSRIGDRADVKGGGHLFLAGNGINLYLIHRPKAPLPSAAGSRVVAWKLQGTEIENGMLLVHDGAPEASYPWLADDGESYLASEIEEWAIVPDNFYETLRKDAVK